MKPFDLEKALAGEPVKLNNGNKAYILGKTKEKYTTKYCLVGYEVLENTDIRPRNWDLTGRAGLHSIYEPISIAGMWEEPKPKRFINGIEVPEPVTEETWEEGKIYYYVIFNSINTIKTDCNFFFRDRSAHRELVNNGLVFKTKEGAEAMARALLNYKVEIK